METTGDSSPLAGYKGMRAALGFPALISGTSDPSYLGRWARGGGPESWLFKPTFSFPMSKFNRFLGTALLSSLWKHLKGENNTEKHKNLFSSLQAFVTVPVPKCTSFWQTKSPWYTFPRVQKEKINKELVTSGGAKVARSLWGSSSSLHFCRGEGSVSEKKSPCSWFLRLQVWCLRAFPGLAHRGLLLFPQVKQRAASFSKGWHAKVLFWLALFLKPRKSITHLKLVFKRYMDFL